jgi:hypothetical protein
MEKFFLVLVFSFSLDLGSNSFSSLFTECAAWTRFSRASPFLSSVLTLSNEAYVAAPVFFNLDWSPPVRRPDFVL